MEKVFTRRPPSDRRRIRITVRLAPALGDFIAARRAETGRSTSQEIELLLSKGALIERILDCLVGTIGGLVGTSDDDHPGPPA